ncbi:CLUMA_CG019306, isoform A [Clunio marinus]|uniref:CLUMA_CG019306, isoform A n=1 Tax=Clunio marinus TaxID=568069 RepID=A0A1J1J0J4_9DIPT|nr:CLUMA_CG019306, isoform A [Clunio marinus]
MTENNGQLKSLGLLLCCLAFTSAVRVQMPGKIIRGELEQALKYVMRQLRILLLIASRNIKKKWNKSFVEAKNKKRYNKVIKNVEKVA